MKTCACCGQEVRISCPACGGRVRVNDDGTYAAHDAGHCNGSHMEWKGCGQSNKPAKMFFDAGQ